MKKLLILISVIMVLCFCSCEKNTNNVNSEKDYNTKTTSNISFEHGVVLPNPQKRNITYSGNNVTLNYMFNNGPTNCTLGLMIFINGFNQPYLVKGENASILMHKFYLNKNEKKTVTISFKPVTGNKGDRLKIYFVVMLNPQYQINKNSNTGYGNNHKISNILPWTLTMKQSIYSKEIKTDLSYKVESISKKLQTQYMNKMRGSTIFKIIGNTSNQIKLKKVSYIKLTIIGFGKPQKYRLAIYVNHNLIKAFDNSYYLNMQIFKNKLSSCDFMLDRDRIKASSSIYAIAVPVDGNTSKSAPVVVKTNSELLLW